MEVKAEKFCFCTTRRFVAFIAAIVTLVKIGIQVAFQTMVYQNLGENKPSMCNMVNETYNNHSSCELTADYANYSVFIAGQILQVFVTFLLIFAIYKEDPDWMWPYLCWLSLNLLLEGFGCLILVYTNPLLSKIMRDFVVYCISLSLSVALIYFTNSYEKELRRRENKNKDEDELGNEETPVEP